MEKTFNGSEERFIHCQPDDDDDQHDADDLIHGIQFSAIVKKMAEAKAGEN